MTATNHALTGAVIGVIVGQPLIAMPLAILSHYICDAIPHYRDADFSEKFLTSPRFKRYLVFEFVMCLLVVALLAASRPVHWQLAVVCAFLAAAPDLLSFGRFRNANQGKRWQARGYHKFSGGIQWFEKPIGAVVEAAWFIAGLVLLLPFIK